MLKYQAVLINKHLEINGFFLIEIALIFEKLKNNALN